jgi:hypothetical protein
MTDRARIETRGIRPRRSRTSWESAMGRGRKKRKAESCAGGAAGTAHSKV